MAEPTVYSTSRASVIAVNGQGVAVPLGLVTNLRVEKRWIVEAINEWGNFLSADIIHHGISATFSWTRSYGPGIDLVGQGLMPEDATIAQFLPFVLRIVDQLAQRNIVTLYRAVAETLSISGAGRTVLSQDVSGQAISIQFESEIN